MFTEESKMSNKSKLISIGVIIYIILNSVSRFVVDIPNIIYIPIAILGIIMILVGAFIEKRNKD